MEVSVFSRKNFHEQVSRLEIEEMPSLLLKGVEARCVRGRGSGAARAQGLDVVSRVNGGTRGH